MRRIGKQIECRDGTKLVAAVEQGASIASECRDITGDVHESSRLERENSRNRIARQTRSRWIHDHSLCRHRPTTCEKILDAGSLDAHAIPKGLGVHLQVGTADSIALDKRDAIGA